MKRTTITWAVFAAALSIVLAVMVYFTVRMLNFEKSMAEAEARATLEENVRLALWRMDSAGALMSTGNRREGITNFGSNSIAQNNIAPDMSRLSSQAQQSMSEQEFQQRQMISNASPVRDWESIAPSLLERISDILPGATLEAIHPGEENDTRRLASIPARLVVPEADMPSTARPWNTPLRVSLMIAWACALLAAGAVARLLGATLSLSERRGAFASAVTHELRTPVTTCRMYSEMLAAGVIQKPEDRQHYLDTLVAESDRLGHLIENVLTYSRLERRLSPDRHENVSVGELLEHALPSLRRRADQAKLPLTLALPEEVGGVMCRTDAVTVQQILLNLVDNACKYGKSEITIKGSMDEAHVHLLVSDCGPGITSTGNLFIAFGKSKTDAVPGIGLGLYLSRRLARELGGDLRHMASDVGAKFELSLPR